MGVPDDMTTEKWNEDAGPIGKGWKPGRVPTDKSDDEGAFGWLKGSFGVFEGNSKTQIGLIEVTSLTHKKTGMRAALFDSPESAAVAGDLAERVGDWSALGPDGVRSPEWQKACHEMYALWQAAGLVYSPLQVGEKRVWAMTVPLQAPAVQ